METRPTAGNVRLPPAPSRGLLGLILAIGLVHGLLYLAVFPPWQHYDEPTHFEYVQLIAERGRLPRAGDYDLAMRQQIASSMQAAGFWKGTQVPPIDYWSQLPPGIGVSELYHPPLYYLLLALPQRFVRHQGVETQLYLARFCSVLLYLVLLATAYGLTKEAFPNRRWLPFVVSAFLALLPPLADVMSSVNNDVGAAAATSLLLFGCVRLVRRGPSWSRLAVCVILAGVCMATKTTAGVVALLVLVVLGYSHLPGVYRRWSLVAGAPVLLVLMLAAITWQGNAAFWYSGETASAPNRSTTATPLGRWALALSLEGQRYPRVISQELDRSTGRSMRGHVVTFGAWFRTPDESTGLVALNLDDARSDHWFRVQATSDWQFYAFTTTISLEAPGVAAYVIVPDQPGAPQMVQVDGLVLVDGAMPVRTAPTFGSDQTVLWGGRQVTNLLRNASAETGWPGLRSWIGNRTIFREPIVRVFHSVLDWHRTAWVYSREASTLFASFWGTFGWNHLVLPPGYFYPLAALCLLGLFGASSGLVRLRRKGWLADPATWRILLLLAVALLVGWGETIARVHPVLVTKHISWPVARYADVVIVPTALLLCAGWSEIIPRRWARVAALVGSFSLVALDLVALATVILPYYYGQS